MYFSFFVSVGSKSLFSACADRDLLWTHDGVLFNSVLYYALMEFTHARRSWLVARVLAGAEFWGSKLWHDHISADDIASFEDHRSLL